MMTMRRINMKICSCFRLYNNTEEVDERQRALQYKCGNEAFVLLTVLVVLQGCLVKVWDMDFLAEGEVSIALAYVAVWWKQIRMAYKGADVPDSRHKSTRICLTFASVIMTACTLAAVPQIIRDGNIKEDLGQLLFFTVLSVSAVITAVIYWVQRKNGCEDTDQKL